MLLTTKADLEQTLNADKRCLVGTCIIRIKRWLTKDGNSFETSIVQLRVLTDDYCLNQQVCIAVVRMLWH